VSVYREVYPITHKIELNKNKHHIYYGAQYTPQQYAALDEHGIVKVGAKVSHHDLLVAGLSKAEISGTDLMLGRISKALTKPYREVALHWEHGTQGVVSEVVRTANQIAILVKTQEPMQVGDKLAGRYGNKGVVAEIVPDSQMVRDEGGNVIDVIMTSAALYRVFPAQIIETAVGVWPTKPCQLSQQCCGPDTVQWAKDLPGARIKTRETLTLPVAISKADGKGVSLGTSSSSSFQEHRDQPAHGGSMTSRAAFKKGGEEFPGLSQDGFDACRSRRS
jgi:DNA-directed RNA polymerase beta subunit